MTVRYFLVAALVASAPEALAQSSPAAPWRPRSARPAAPGDPAVASFNEGAPERVALLIESAGAPQQVVVEQRLRDESTWRRDAARNVIGSGTCTTPCVLHVPRASLLLRAEAPGMRATDTRVEPLDINTRLRLRTSSSTSWNVGVGLVSVGVTLFIAVAGLAIAAQVRDGFDLSAGAGIGVGAVAGVLLAVGIPLLVTNRTGVASQRPWRHDE